MGSSSSNIIKLTQNTTIPVSTHIITAHNSLNVPAQFGKETFSSQTITYNFRGLLFITWKCLWSQMKIHYGSRLAQQWFSLRITLVIGWVSWAHAAVNGFSTAGRRLHCVKVISWKDIPTFCLWIFILFQLTASLPSHFLPFLHQPSSSSLLHAFLHFLSFLTFPPPSLCQLSRSHFDIRCFKVNCLLRPAPPKSIYIVTVPTPVKLSVLSRHISVLSHSLQ